MNIPTTYITDSRGAGLLLHLQALGHTNLQVLVHKGAGYELAVLKSLAAIKRHKPELVVLLTGVCDLTWRCKQSKITGLRHNTVSGNVQHVLNAARTAVDLLKAFGTFRISLATVTGIDLTDYNNAKRKHMTGSDYKQYCITDKISHPLQDTLNASILEINKGITTMNQINSVPTIWTAGVVHLHTKSKTYHYYIRLYDGCHPDEQTKVAWAKQIHKSIIRIHTPVTHHTHNR